MSSIQDLFQQGQLAEAAYADFSHADLFLVLELMIGRHLTMTKGGR
jgi:hypothetical protein